MEKESVLENVAKRNGVSVEKVEAEIQEAICQAIRISQENNDVRAIQMWDVITNGTGMCTPTELIKYLAIYISLRAL